MNDFSGVTSAGGHAGDLLQDLGQAGLDLLRSATCGLSLGWCGCRSSGCAGVRDGCAGRAPGGVTAGTDLAGEGQPGAEAEHAAPRSPDLRLAGSISAASASGIGGGEVLPGLTMSRATTGVVGEAELAWRSPRRCAGWPGAGRRRRARPAPTPARSHRLASATGCSFGGRPAEDRLAVLVDVRAAGRRSSIASYWSPSLPQATGPMPGSSRRRRPRPRRRRRRRSPRSTGRSRSTHVGEPLRRRRPARCGPSRRGWRRRPTPSA